MKRISEEEDKDGIIANYFNIIENEINYLGDSPYEPNIGLLSIAGLVRDVIINKKKTPNIHILDLNIVERQIREKEKRPITENDIKEELEQFSNVSIVGLSFMTSTYGIWGIDLIRICREIFPSQWLFLGGIHPSVQQKEIYKELQQKFKKEMIDGIVVGEGEFVFCDIIKYCDSSTEQAKKKIKAHPHIYTGEGSEKERARLSGDRLSKLPFPAYDCLVPNIGTVTVRIYTMRGCTNNCSFCSVSSFHRNNDLKSKVSYGNTDNIFANLISLIDSNIKISHLVIGDLSFGATKDEAKQFLIKMTGITKKYKEKYNNDLKIWCQCRASDITKEMVTLLKSVGCVQIAIGCEGATQNQLDKISKDEKVGEVEKKLKIVKNAGINIQGYWVIGLPGDDENSVKATQNKILEYIDKGYNTIPHITILCPYPNTPVAQKQSGIKILSRNWADYWMNCDPFGCGKPVYQTINDKEKKLLCDKKIYSLWLETLKLITQKIKEKK
jgi:radical SAM superfamily enzyme YgiQ (UPF0313 family)